MTAQVQRATNNAAVPVRVSHCQPGSVYLDTYQPDIALRSSVVCPRPSTVLRGARCQCTAEEGVRAGDLRMVKAMEKRVAAATAVGYSKVVAPVGAKAVVSQALKPHVVECRDVSGLVQLVRGRRVRRGRSTKQKLVVDEDPEESG